MIPAAKLLNSLPRRKHAMIVSQNINLIVTLISCVTLLLNLVTQIWKINLKYTGSSQPTRRHSDCENTTNRLPRLAELEEDFMDLCGIFVYESFTVYINVDVVVKYIFLWEMMPLVIDEMIPHFIRIMSNLFLLRLIGNIIFAFGYIFIHVI